MLFLEIVLLVLTVVITAVRCVNTEDAKKQTRIGSIGLALVVLMLVFFGSIGTINTGEKGIVLRMGRLTDKTLDEGVYFKVPVIDKVVKMSVQVNAFTAQSTAASKDMQEVNSSITLNYQLDGKRVGSIYRTMRNEYESRVISPAIQEAVKAATAKYDAESLIGNREDVRRKIKELVSVKLEAPYGILVKDVSITDFNFSAEFNTAIEQKATAVQKSETAKRDLQRIITEQKGQIEVAKAQAESLRLQKQNVTKELVELRKIELGQAQIQMMKEKWDGHFPTTMVGGNTPLMLSLPNN